MSGVDYFSGSVEWFKTRLKYHTLCHACCCVEVVYNFSSAGNVVCSESSLRGNSDLYE